MDRVVNPARWWVAGSGLAAGVLLIVGWYLVGPVLTGALSAGVFFGGRALSRRLRRESLAAQQCRQEVRARADQQHRWASRGDSRGVYGAEGAALMGSLAPVSAPRIIPPGDDLEVATVVHTPSALGAMLTQRPPCWRYAAFVSVLVQRRATVAHRLRDAGLGFATPNDPLLVGQALGSELEAGLFFSDRLADLSALVDQVDDLMLSPAFQGVFGDREEHADGDGIVGAAHRLMDCHDQLLDLAEHCRGVRVPRNCADLQRDMSRLAVIPLNGFATFISDFTDRVAEMADVARYATGDVQLDPVELAVEDDDELLERVSGRLQQLGRGC